MVRGCQRRIIHLKNTGSEVFEEAYFILNDKYRTEHGRCDDMVREANRIIEDNLCREGVSLGASGFSGVLRGIAAFIKRTAIPFLIGGVTGAAVCALVIFL